MISEEWGGGGYGSLIVGGSGLVLGAVVGLVERWWEEGGMVFGEVVWRGWLRSWGVGSLSRVLDGKRDLQQG